MRPIRVLIVDDAVVVRRMLTEVLRGDEQIEVAGTAANGRIGLAKIEQLNPDIVILDIEMPEMDGLQALAQLRKQFPLLPVIIFSTLTDRGAAKTLEALALGATDYVTKPANVGSVSLARECIRTELITRIKAFCGKTAGIGLEYPAGADSKPAYNFSPNAAPAFSNLSPAAAQPNRPRQLSATVLTRVPPKFPARVDLVAIGVSTGGPNALTEIFRRLPRELPVPIVITQHMPPQFTRILAERLSECSGFAVREGASGEVLKPSQAWIAPGGLHMTVERIGQELVLQTNTEPHENSCRPAVDVMFRSVARAVAGHSLGVILTGMGRDGLRGCQELCGRGAQVIVQDEQTSVVWGMPGFVARAELAEAVLPLNEIGGEIIKRVMAGRTGMLIAATNVEESVNA
jgi:two-component system, chemotaxis family, protein-glutamate methylesterase/glutaminase